MVPDTSAPLTDDWLSLTCAPVAILRSGLRSHCMCWGGGVPSFLVFFPYKKVWEVNVKLLGIFNRVHAACAHPRERSAGEDRMETLLRQLVGCWLLINKSLIGGNIAWHIVAIKLCHGCQSLGGVGRGRIVVLVEATGKIAHFFWKRKCQWHLNIKCL